MKRYIIIFKEEVNYDLISSVGGIVVDGLNKIPKLVIVDLPTDKIEELELYEEIEKVEEDHILDIDMSEDNNINELQEDNEDPYLLMRDSYIQMPKITYNSIVLDIILDKSIVSGTSAYYFDLRLNSEGTDYASVGSNGNDYFTAGMTASVGGVQKTTNSNFIPNGVRTEVKYNMSITNTNAPVLCASRGLTYRMPCRLYSVRFYLDTTLVAHYDMSTGTVNDQSGNGNHGVLTGGEWVGVETIEETFPSFAKIDGGLEFTLNALRARDYWDRGLTGKGVKVGVLDLSFPKSYYIDDYAMAHSIVNSTPYTLAYGSSHGLECVSQISSHSTYTEEGIHLGISNDVDIYVVRGAEYAVITASQYITSLNWFMNNGVYVISASLLSQTESYTSVFVAIDTLVNSYDGVLFMSVGNQNTLIGTGSNVLNSYEPITLVGGIGRNYKRYFTATSGSNQSPNLEFMAVYVSYIKKNSIAVDSPLISDEVSIATGTSYSCPQAVAVFCLYKEFYKNKTNHEIVSLMSQNSLKLDGRTEKDNYYGHGLLQPSQDILKLPRVIDSSGLKFLGENDYIDCGNSSSLDLKDNFTLIADVCIDYGNNGYLFSKYDKTIEEGLFYGVFLGHKYENGNKFIANYSHGSKVFKEVSYPFSISDNKRRKLVVVYSYPNIKIYLDGVLIKEDLAMDGNMLNSSSSSGSPRLYIGSPSKQTGSSFTGTLFEAKIYNRSLSNEEVLNHNNLTNNLVLHYKLSGEETIVNDLSGNGNHGTIFGARPNVRKTNL